MRLYPLLLLFFCSTLFAQTNFTKFYGYPDDRAQEKGLIVVPDGEALLVVGMAEEIPEGGPGLSLLRTRKEDGGIDSRSYLSRDLPFFDTRASGSFRGDFLVSARTGGSNMYLEYFTAEGRSVWSTEVDIASSNANRSLLVGVRNAAFQFYEPFVAGEQRSLLRNFTATGEVGWTVDLTPESDNYQIKVVVGESGHPIVLIGTSSGFQLRSYDRLNGSLRWERDFSTINGFSYPLQLRLALDRGRDRLLVIGARSGGFEQGSRGGLASFTYTGSLDREHDLGELTYGLPPNISVTPGGSLFAHSSCSGILWPDYRSTASQRSFSLCGEINRAEFSSLTYLNDQEIYLAGKQAKDNRFDQDLLMVRANESEVIWSHTEGNAGRQDEEYPVSAARATDGSGYYFLASIPLPNSDYVAQLTKVDPEGVIRWQRQLPLEGIEHSYGRGLKTLRNGSVLASVTGFKRTGDFLFSPNGELISGQEGFTDFNHQVRQLAFPQELEDGRLLIHEGQEVRGGPDQLILFEYQAAGFSSLITTHLLAGFPSGELTGMTDLEDGSVLLLGRPDRELSTVKAARYDLASRSVRWAWETGNFGNGSREIDGAVLLPNGEIILAIVGTDISVQDERASGFTLLVRLSADGRELSRQRITEAPGNSLNHFSLSLLENEDLLLLGKNAEDPSQLRIRTFSREDFNLLTERTFRIDSSNSLHLAQSQYLGDGQYLFFGSAFAPDRAGQQLFLTITDDKSIPTSTTSTLDFAADLRLFPNPTAAVARLVLPLRSAAALHGRMYDLRGSLLKQWSFPPTRNHQHDLDLTDLPAGSYLLQVRSGNAVSRRWIVKQ